jgi:hypothetical protein
MLERILQTVETQTISHSGQGRSKTDNHLATLKTSGRHLLAKERADRKYQGKDIRRALNAFDFLGISLKHAIVDFIERQGIVLDEGHSYSLKEMEGRLRPVLGEDARKLMIERLRKILES